MVEDWQQWFAPGAAWVLTYLIHSTLLIAAVWLISRRLEGRPSALDALWKTALVGGLVTATLQTAAGVSPLGGRLDLAASAPVAAVSGEGDPRSPARVSKETGPESMPEPDRVESGSATASASGSVPGSGSDTGSGSVAGTGSDTASDSGTGSATASLAGPRSPSGPTAGRSSPTSDASASSVSLGNARLWIAAGFLAWTALAAFFGLGLVRSWWRLRRVLADRRPIVAGPASTMLARLAAGNIRRVRLSASARVDVPIAVGVLRPEIVLPERALYQLEPAELESMLAHELAHLVRRDPAWRLLTGFIHRVMFLQPLNRMVAVHLESASEVLCDDWAVERTERPLALARCLTEVAGWVASPLGESVPAMARRGSGLGRRVRRLVAAGIGPAQRGRRDRWPLPLSAGALALVVFTAPGATEIANRPPAPLPPAPKLVPASSGAQQAARPGGASERERVDTGKKSEARRMLRQLRSGRVSDHDLSDWIALAQLVGSPDKGGLGQLLQSAGTPGWSWSLASAGGPGLSEDEIEDIIEGAVTQALGGSGIDVDVDFDVDVDTDGDIDVHINDIDVKVRRGDDDEDDEDSGFDFDLEFGMPDFDVEVEVPEPPEPPDPPDPPDFMVPEPPEPPEPPEAECDDNDDHNHQHHGHQHLSREQRHAIHEQARQAREHARQAREQARQARQQAHQAREQALRQAAEARRQAHQQRDQALRQAAKVREQALRQAEQAREQAMKQHRDKMREFERAMRDAERERQRQYKEMWRNLQEQERERQQEAEPEPEDEDEDEDEDEQSL